MQALSNAELLSLLAAARAHSERDFLMILVAYCHGLRASEVVSIVRDDIKDGRLEVRRLKGSEHTEQSLHQDQNPLLNERQALFDFASNFEGNQKLFPLTRRQFGRIVSRHAITVGLPEHKRHPHMLKHTMGAEIYEKTKDLRLVRMRLGHKRESSSLIYAGRVAERAADAQVESLIGSRSLIL